MPLNHLIIAHASETDRNDALLTSTKERILPRLVILRIRLRSCASLMLQPFGLSGNEGDDWQRLARLPQPEVQWHTDTFTACKG